MTSIQSHAAVRPAFGSDQQNSTTISAERAKDQEPPDVRRQLEVILALLERPSGICSPRPIEQVILPTEATISAERLDDTVSNDLVVSISAATTATPSPSLTPSSTAIAQTSNINASVQWVMRESYLQTTQDLFMHYDKLSFHNDVKAALREELTRAQGVLSKVAGKEPDARLLPTFETRPIETDYAGRPFEAAPAPLTPVDKARGGPLEPVVNAVMELIPQVLPTLIASKFPNANHVPDAVDQIVKTVMGVLNGVRDGAGLDEMIGTVVEGVYDLLPTIIPSLIVARFGPGAAHLAEPVTNLIMSMIPNPHTNDGADDGTIETKAELEAYIKKLEEKLNSVGDDAQLANLDLQNNLQKQQQILQMMSNVSKVVHDTDLAVVRQIGT